MLWLIHRQIFLLIFLKVGIKQQVLLAKNLQTKYT